MALLTNVTAGGRKIIQPNLVQDSGLVPQIKPKFIIIPSFS